MAKKRRKSTLKTDYGTDQLRDRHTVRVELASPKEKRARILDQTLLDKLFLDNKIPEDLFDAGERFRGDMYRAQMLGCPGSNPNRTTQSSQHGISDKQANALTRIGHVLKKVEKDHGPQGEARVFNFLLYDENIPDYQDILSSILQAYQRWSD